MSICIKSIIKNMNLVIGCSIGCSYCYARNNCRRFHMTDDFSVPVFEERKLHLIDTKKPHTWLMTGLSDFSGWKPEWRDTIFARMAQNPQHDYLFLTKRPELLDFEVATDNVWMGTTVTCDAEKERIQSLRHHVKAKHYHITFEPLFSAIPDIDFSGIDWIVVGTETGKRKGKVAADPAWVLDIVQQTRKQNIPVFMKEDLLPIMGEVQMIQQMPSAFCKG